VPCTKRLSLTSLDRGNICRFKQKHSDTVTAALIAKHRFLFALMKVRLWSIETQMSASSTQHICIALHCTLSLLYITDFEKYYDIEHTFFFSNYNRGTKQCGALLASPQDPLGFAAHTCSNIRLCFPSSSTYMPSCLLSLALSRYASPVSFL
jgi:hypothetical protein